jgi:hypothetical protein
MMKEATADQMVRKARTVRDVCVTVLLPLGALWCIMVHNGECAV